MRSGASALSALSATLNVHVLCALQEEERSLAALSQAVGLPPASTMRAYLRALSDQGAIERKQELAFPGSVRYELTGSGEGLVRVGVVLQEWLKEAPNGGMALGSPAAKSAVKALVDGWDAAIVRALAARPCTLTELARAIPQVSYPTLERRLTAMRRVGLTEPRSNGAGRGTPYGATSWLRGAVAPLVAATAWERRHAPVTTGRPAPIDVEALFLLALPMIQLPEDVTGACRLSVELRNGSDACFAGTTVSVENGRIVSAVTRLGGDPEAWATGTASNWYRWIAWGDDEEVEMGGDRSLILALAHALRTALVPALDRGSPAKQSTARN